MRIGVYVDGFNLYYGFFHHGPPEIRPYKWLNPLALAQHIMQRLKLSGEVTTLRYFSAKAKHNPDDPDQPTRQQMLFRALETLPMLTMYMGQHNSVTKRGILRGDPERTIRKFKTREEKGSDANLAAYLALDSSQHLIDAAIVITNDSDFAHAIEITIERTGVPVFIASPQPKSYVSGALTNAASGTLVIDGSLLPLCQFPRAGFMMVARPDWGAGSRRSRSSPGCRRG